VPSSPPAYRVPLMRNAFLREDETRKALADFVLTSDRFSMGRECAGFEEEFAAYQGRRHAVLFNSGGSANLALIQALKNLGRLRDGDKVGFTAVTWSTNVMPIIQLGLNPVPLDCKPTLLNTSSEELLARLENCELRCVFLTNVLGFTGDLVRIRQICVERDICLIEDNCESLGSVVGNERTGNFGVAATFSFFVAHHMSTIEGGMVGTDDLELDQMLRLVRANGWDRNLQPAEQQRLREANRITSAVEASYTFYDLGFNLRPTEITGFLGRRQLTFLDDNIDARAENYRQFAAAVAKNEELISLQPQHQSVVSSFALPILCRTPDLKQKYSARLAEAGIEQRPIIAGNMQRQPFYKKYVKAEYDLPGADLIHDCGIYCGNYPELTQDDLDLLFSCLAKD
jgi:CDP-6-deoxy-D-xylo-4-hexulose-3-dehydrase